MVYDDLAECRSAVNRQKRQRGKEKTSEYLGWGVVFLPCFPVPLFPCFRFAGSALQLVAGDLEAVEVAEDSEPDVIRDEKLGADGLNVLGRHLLDRLNNLIE